MFADAPGGIAVSAFQNVRIEHLLDPGTAYGKQFGSNPRGHGGGGFQGVIAGNPFRQAEQDGLPRPPPVQILLAFYIGPSLFADVHRVLTLLRY